MAVAFDAVSESAVLTASHNHTHTPVAATTQGIAVLAMWSNATAAYSSITIGGVDIPVYGGQASDTGGENLNTQAYFLGSGVPAGAQTIQFNRTSSSNQSYANVYSVTALNDTVAVGIVLESESQVLAEESIDDGSPGNNSLRLCGLASGKNIFPSVGANSTLGAFVDLVSPSESMGSCYETVVGQGSRPVGFAATSDDVAAVYFAITETAVPNPTVTIIQTSYEGFVGAEKSLAGEVSVTDTDDDIATILVRVTDA